MQKKDIAIYGENNSYLSEYQGILDDFKEIHKLMSEANGPEVFYLLTGAQKKLTRKSIDEVDKMIKDLVVNFTDENIEKFMEKIISMLSSLETTKQLYGNIIDVDSIKKYISKKITILTIKRYKIIENQILKKRFIEESKLSVLYSNITNCKKIVMFGIDLDSTNVKAIEFVISMLNNLVTNSARMGVDNYTREVIGLEISHYEAMLEEILAAESYDINDSNDAAVRNDTNNLVNEKAVEESCNMLVTLNNSSTSKADQIKKLTDQFVNTANDVIPSAIRNTGGGKYVNEALRQFASLMSTVQTLNYLQSGAVHIETIAKVISNHLIDMASANYKELISNFDSIQVKSQDDIKMFIRETDQYCNIFLKAYEMYPDDIFALKNYIEILDKKLRIKDILKLNKDDEININRERKSKADIIRRKDSSYKLQELEIKKKKSLFSMLWGK